MHSYIRWLKVWNIILCFSGETDTDSIGKQIEVNETENLELVEILSKKSIASSESDFSVKQEPSMDSSCDKLLAFTMEFLSNKASSLASNPKEEFVRETKDFPKTCVYDSKPDRSIRYFL